MLRIIDSNFDDVSNYNVEHNVEKLFDTIVLKGTPTERKIIELIEKGHWNDGNSFIDRFGYKLRIEELSTGAKAVLCVLNCEDIVVDTIECGLNAISAMICFCKSGNILLRINKLCIDCDIEDSMDDTSIDVRIGNLRFFDLSALLEYVNGGSYRDENDIEEIKGVIEHV